MKEMFLFVKGRVALMCLLAFRRKGIMKSSLSGGDIIFIIHLTASGITRQVIIIS